MSKFVVAIFPDEPRGRGKQTEIDARSPQMFSLDQNDLLAPHREILGERNTRLAATDEVTPVLHEKTFPSRRRATLMITYSSGMITAPQFTFSRMTCGITSAVRGHHQGGFLQEPTHMRTYSFAAS